MLVSWVRYGTCYLCTHTYFITECKYDYGEWGDCDIETNKRTRIRTLISVDEVDCQPEKSVSKTCTKSNGEGKTSLH